MMHPASKTIKKFSSEMHKVIPGFWTLFLRSAHRWWWTRASERHYLLKIEHGPTVLQMWMEEMIHWIYEIVLYSSGKLITKFIQYLKEQWEKNDFSVCYTIRAIWKELYIWTVSISDVNPKQYAERESPQEPFYKMPC